MGKPKEAADALRLTTPHEFSNNPAVFDYAADLYRQGKIVPALEVLNKRKDTEDSEGDRLRLCLWAEGNDSKLLEGAITRWMERYPEAENLGDVAMVLLLLGRKPEAQEIARGVKVPAWPFTAEREQYNKLSRAFASGENISEEALLEAAKDLRSCLCSAHFLIGLTHLADRDRAGARQHFRAAVNTQDYFNNDYTLSRVLLARLENPAWPRWWTKK